MTTVTNNANSLQFCDTLVLKAHGLSLILPLYIKKKKMRQFSDLFLQQLCKVGLERLTLLPVKRWENCDAGDINLLVGYLISRKVQTKGSDIDWCWYFSLASFFLSVLIWI